MVTKQHKLYIEAKLPTEMMRDLVAGERAVKDRVISSNGLKYVPKLSLIQTPDEFRDYINRPAYDNFLQRALDESAGKIFAKVPTIKANATLTEYFDNITLTGKSLIDISQECVNEVITVGRVGLLVENAGQRPYITVYKTESIDNWKHETINGEHTLTMVKFAEERVINVNDFETETELQYKSLHLVNNEYEIRIYTKKASDSSDWDVKVIKPLLNGKPLTYIPFVSITPKVLQLEPTKSPLLDLGYINREHFALNVGLSHILHWVGNPFMVGFDIQKNEMEGFKMGSSSISFFSSPKARIDVIQIDSSSALTIESKIIKCEQKMSVLGAGFLQVEKNGVEAENTVAMRNAGSHATIISVSDTVSRGILKILEMGQDWSGTSGEIIFQLNTDYNLTEMPTKDIIDLGTAKQVGVLSDREIFYNLKKGERLEPNTTFEEWQDRKDDELKEVVNAIAKKPGEDTEVNNLLNKVK